MKKSLIIIFLLFSANIFSQYEILIDKYSTDDYTYPFIREGMKIEFLMNNNPSALVVSEYDLESDKFVPIKEFYITEWFNNYNRDGYNWFYLREDTFGEFSINYNPKTKKATFADKYSRYTQEFTFISGATSIKNKVSSIRKKFFDGKFKNDKEIGIKLNEIINKRNIKSLPNYRNTINNDVYSDELKNNYLNILENEIKSFNDSIISLFRIDLENKKTESLVSYMESLIEYDNIDSLQNKVNDKFQLDKPLSFTKTERFKEYFVDFIINVIEDNKKFRIDNNFKQSISFFVETKEGKIKIENNYSAEIEKLRQFIDRKITFENLFEDLKKINKAKEDLKKLSDERDKFGLDWGILKDYTLDYNFSEDEKKQIELFNFFNITPKKQIISLEVEVKLELKNRTFLYGKKEPLTLYVNKNLLKAEEKSTFAFGDWKQNEIFFKQKSNDLETITTKTFESQKNKIKLNLKNTYGLRVKDFYSKLKVIMFNDLNSYFNSADRGKAIDGYFSNNKKIVNVYTEWVYELYIENKKVNNNILVKHNRQSPLDYLSNPTFFNKPFYTIDVYKLY
ncbi:hypothetical protein N9I20_04965 [Flavobacteriaceae bacterium]|nr:hypothetical protein [Flavobacteriaceae bacterium]